MLSKKEHNILSERRRKALALERDSLTPKPYTSNKKTIKKCVARAKEIRQKDALNGVHNHNHNDASYYEGAYGNFVDRIGINPCAARDKRHTKKRFGTYTSTSDLSSASPARIRFIPPKKRD